MRSLIPTVLTDDCIWATDIYSDAHGLWTGLGILETVSQRTSCFTKALNEGRHFAVERKEVDLFKILIFVTQMNQTQYGLGKTPVLTVTLI